MRRTGKAGGLFGLGMLLVSPHASPGQAGGRTPVVTTPRFAFYSDFEPNLNDALIAAGVARKSGKPELFHSGAEAPCFDKLPESARAAWDGAADYYAKIISPAGSNARQQYLLRVQLAGFDEELKDDEARQFVAIARSFRAAATPAYRACRWAVQDEKNRRWIEELKPRLAADEQKIGPRLEELYRKKWTGLPIPVDVVETVDWSGANTILRDAGSGHILISIENPGRAALEVVFHEASHILMGRDAPVRQALESAASAVDFRMPGELWHVVLFYTTGEAVRHVLDDGRVPAYTPMVYEIFDRGWGGYRKPLETAWRPYVDGGRTLSEAAASLIEALTPPMDLPRLREFAARYTAAWCSRDPASVAAFFGERGSLQINKGSPSIGRAAIAAAAQGFMTAFPDMVVKMSDVSLEGVHAVYRWTLAGTNTGPGGTGKAVRIRGYEEWEMGADALIAESRGHFDEAEYQRQLKSGALTAPVPDPSDPLAAAFRQAVTAAEAGSGGVVGVAAVHVESGRRLSVRGGEVFQMASVFKVPVAIAVLGAVEMGTLRLDQSVEIRRQDRRKVGPLYDEWKPGMRVTIERMVDVMLVFSDNTAADKLIALLGGPSAVEKDLASRGVAGVRISLDEKGMGEAMKKDLAAFERGDENGASPDAFAALLARLFRGELLSGASTDRILDAMRRCRTGDRRLRAGLPKGTDVLDKTGTVGSCSNDAGIVRLPDGTHLALAVFTRGGRDAAARDETIARIARAAWRAFVPEGAVSGRTAGRASLRPWSSP